MQLTPELLLQIVGHLTLRERARLSTVCRWLYTLCHDRALWRELSVEEEDRIDYGRLATVLVEKKIPVSSCSRCSLLLTVLNAGVVVVLWLSL